MLWLFVEKNCDLVYRSHKNNFFVLALGTKTFIKNCETEINLFHYQFYLFIMK